MVTHITNVNLPKIVNIEVGELQIQQARLDSSNVSLEQKSGAVMGTGSSELMVWQVV